MKGFVSNVKFILWQNYAHLLCRIYIQVWHGKNPKRYINNRSMQICPSLAVRIHQNSLAQSEACSAKIWGKQAKELATPLPRAPSEGMECDSVCSTRFV